jgi:hypothetical protein
LTSGGEDEGAFLEALTDPTLYSIGAHFTDRNPDLVDDVLGRRPRSRRPVWALGGARGRGPSRWRSRRS